MNDQFFWTALIILFVWNGAVFLLYGADKLRSRRGQWRITENTLIVPSFFLAASGAILGMVVFNHKTSKMKFRILVPIAFLVNIAEIIAIHYILK